MSPTGRPSHSRPVHEGTPDLLRAAGLPMPMAIDPDGALRLSWAPGRGQTPARVTVTGDQGRPAWSGTVDGPSAAVTVPGGALAAGARYSWSVQTLDHDGRRRRSTTQQFGTMARWQHSQPIWAPARPAAWRDYDLTVVVRRPRPRGGTALGTGTVAPGADRIGLVLRAPDYLSGYVWTIDLATGEIIAGTRRDGDVSVMAQLAIPRWETGGTGDVTIVVRARGDVLTTVVDGVVADTRTVQAWSRGGAGLTSPADARSTITRFTVTDPRGTVLVDEDFADGLTALACGAVVDGGLEVAENSNSLIPAGPEWMFLRGGFTVDRNSPVAWATLWVAADSPVPARQFVHRTWLNGAAVGLGPSRPTDGEARCQGFDVTALVRPGLNTVSAQAWATAGQRYQAEVAVHYLDGRTVVEGTSPEWQARDGAEPAPACGSVGTGYYAAPIENLRLDRWPAGLHDAGIQEPGWGPPAARRPFASIRPSTTADVRPVRRRAVASHERPDGSVVLDFGRTVVGGVVLHGHRDEPASVRLRFGELLNEDGSVRWRLNTGNRYQDRWQLPRGDCQGATWGWRVFRYVEAQGLQPGDDVEAIEHIYPLEAAERPSSTDPAFDRVMGLCAQTIEATDGDLMVDAWSRERAPYEADAYLQARSQAVLTADTSLASHTLTVLLGTRTWPTEWPFYLVMLARDLAWRSGDPATVENHYHEVRRLLPWQWLDAATGLLRKTTGCDGSGSQTDHDIVDWPASERDGYQFGPVNTVVNAVAHGAFQAFAQIADMLGRIDDAAQARQTAARLRAAAQTHLWDEAAGAFADGLAADGSVLPHHAAHATVFAVSMGLCDEHRMARAGAFLAARGMATSVYAAPFLIDALVRCGRPGDATALMTATGDRSWTAMIQRGGGATFEAWNQAVKPNLTCAHPWGASPLFLAAESLAGIRPTAPGYATFAVSPVLGGLPDLRVDVPTVRGTIHVQASREKDRIVCRVTVPPSSRATFTAAHRHRLVTVDGHPGPSDEAHLEPGPHTVTMTDTSRPPALSHGQ